MYRNQRGWIAAYKEKSALWIHDGNPKRPHAELTSGKHSSGFFNSKLVIPDDKLLSEAASDLLHLYLEQEGTSLSAFSCVAGPQTGATRLAELISRLVNIMTEGSCDFVSPAKFEQGGVKSMTLTDEECATVKGKNVLVCEDVLTTAGSVALAIDAIVRAGGKVLPFILVLVNRSGLSEACGRKIISLINHSMPIWEPDDCPLCKQESVALRPKDPPEWARLNADY